MTQIVITELYFIVKKNEVDYLFELPHVGYMSLTDAMKDCGGGEDNPYSVYKYDYIWDIIIQNRMD